MSSSDLKRKLKQNKVMPENLTVRLHRAISWLKCAEENTTNHDLQFLSLWISYNACYAIDEKMEDEILSNNINDNEYGGLSHENEEISIIVKGCFNTLEEKCQELLKTRYLLDFSQALSHQDIKSRTGVSVRTIERSMPKCEEILRTCIVYKASQQGLRLF